MNDDSIPDTKKREHRIALIKYFAENDPDGGMAWLSSIDPASGEVAGAYGVFASMLARQDIDLWIEYYEQLSSNENRQSFIQGGLLTFGRTDAKQAWSMAEEIFANSPELASIKQQLFQQMSSQNGDGFWEVVSQKAVTNEEDEGEMLINFFTYAQFKDQSNAVSALEQLE